MRREWLNPELVNLQVKQTREELDCESEGGVEKCIWPHKHVCPRCGYDFGHCIGSHYAWKHHVEVAKCGGNVDRVEIEVPLS